MKETQSKLSFGAIYGGPEVSYSKIAKAIDRLMVVPDELASYPIPSESARLNVVFHVPGSLLKPEFVGARTGSLSRKENIMMVQIAVPENLITFVLPSPKLKQFLFESTREAVRIAKLKFTKFKMPFAEVEFLGLIDLMEKKL